VCGVFPEGGKANGPVEVDGVKGLKRIEAPELPVDETFMHPEAIDLPTRL
jgi:hypothetical protein